uniref:PI31 proteasome regulator C-terminal domain-containing protein n=1 Tax=Knipowitschia caucasica TaxID=637954 RepID=A0AAV2M4K0_KNICA
MIMDPLHSGYPRSGFDPSSGIPDILPPGAVPPGARFDPFGPLGLHRPGISNPANSCEIPVLSLTPRMQGRPRA